MRVPRVSLSRIVHRFWTATLAFVGIYFFLLPAGMIVLDLRDPGLRSGGVPRFAYRWHRQLAPNMEAWAGQRVNSERAQQGLPKLGISGTEWPIFSAVWFLLATESLQSDWQMNPSRADSAPVDLAAGAIEAATRLIVDPAHATWVKRYWGEDYLERENLFYRMLLISGLSSYQALTGNQQYEPTLRQQVQTLAAELDASPFGLLDDYPGQCYPIDIVPAIAVIRRADAVLGTDHSDFVARSIRGFQDDRLDPATQLPAYFVDSRSGQALSPASGVGMSYIMTWAHELWPERARAWYEQFEANFWQERAGIAGWRERAEASGAPDWYIDVDAGPVIAGFGTAATAFGISAARVNGRSDHAHKLGSEALVASWPLLHGRLLMPRLLSNFADAPLVGESAMLFIFTRPGPTESAFGERSTLPPIVFVGLGAYLLIGAILLGVAVRRWRARSRASGSSRQRHGGARRFRCA